MMRFIEAPLFTVLVQGLLGDDEYRYLQLALLLRPEQGAIIPASGGLRKIRWRLKSTGKRGGLRVIYYWGPGEETIYMLTVYAKHEREDLTPAQIRRLRRLVQEGLA